MPLEQRRNEIGHHYPVQVAVEQHLELGPGALRHLERD